MHAVCVRDPMSSDVALSADSTSLTVQTVYYSSRTFKTADLFLTALLLLATVELEAIKTGGRINKDALIWANTHY